MKTQTPLLVIKILAVISMALVMNSCVTNARYAPMDSQKTVEVKTETPSETKTLESYFSIDKQTEIQIIEAGGKGKFPEVHANLINRRKTTMVLDMMTAYQMVDWKKNPAKPTSVWFEGCKTKDDKAEVLECAKTKLTLNPGESRKVSWRFKTGLREFVLPLRTAQNPDEIRIKFKFCMPLGPCATESYEKTQASPATAPTVKK